MEKYKMDHENRGHALIINNRKFHPSFEMPEREGSDVDASAIYQRLQELGFDCDLLNDATESQILQKLKEYMPILNYLDGHDSCSKLLYIVLKLNLYDINNHK